MRQLLIGIVFFWVQIQATTAQTIDSAAPSLWADHFQLTIISQRDARFPARYTGMNSLADTAQTATSVTATLYLGRKLWKGAAVYCDPELSGGSGLSGALGVAGALNGETYRIGDPSPVVTIARAYVQQDIPLGNTSYEEREDDVNQVGGKIPTSRLTLSAGKFSMDDFFDDNSYSHDPRSQFMNWSLMSNGAWDYPANTRGYTFGFVAELIKPTWAARISSVAVSTVANHSHMEYVLGKAHSETAEFEKKLTIHKRQGTIRLLFNYTASRAPSYKEGLAALQDGDTALLKVIDGQGESPTYGGHKTGIGLNMEQQLTDNLGAFARVGWNDGQHVSWAFTEIDQTATLGLSLKGTRWKRKQDIVGLAEAVNGISSEHQAFLKAGGFGFIIGDGNLNYGHEAITEFYYNARLSKIFFLTFDYELVDHPGYNKDRGPVNAFSFRGHIEF